MGEILALLVIAGAVAFVAAPFFAAAPGEAVDAPARAPVERQRLERQKLDAYAAIKDVEFDTRMGKLSETDSAALREKYTAQALEAIAALEALQGAPPRQLAGARRPTRIAFCPACGRGVPPRANFCPACGRALKEAVA